MVAHLGIDVSKGYADFCLLGPKIEPLEKSFRLDDTRNGHDALRQILKKNITDHSLKEVRCAVESTGGYENNWYASLITLSSELPVKVARLNPLGVFHNAKAGLSRNVTDQLSARYIAQYPVSHADKVDYTEQNGYYGSFRSLHKHILMLKKQNTQLMNELKQLVQGAFPELMGYCKQGIPDRILELLCKYPTATEVVKAQVRILAKIKGLTTEKATELKTKAKTSVASRTNDIQGFTIRSIASQVLMVKGLIREQKEYLGENCKGPEVDLLKSMIGVADYSAAAIMVEIEDIGRFATPGRLASYFGMHPVLKNSGDKAVSRLSKKGRASLRASLYMPAMSAMSHDPHLKAIYQKHIDKGKSHRQAIVVVMHKMLRIVHGILSSAKPYDAKVDSANQKKNASKTEQSLTDGTQSARRFQSEDPDAPISRRETKRRRVQAESQVCNAEQERDHPPTPMTKIQDPQQSNHDEMPLSLSSLCQPEEEAGTAEEQPVSNRVVTDTVRNCPKRAVPFL